jgi:hypothetical protein
MDVATVSSVDPDRNSDPGSKDDPVRKADPGSARLTAPVCLAFGLLTALFELLGEKGVKSFFATNYDALSKLVGNLVPLSKKNKRKGTRNVYFKNRHPGGPVLCINLGEGVVRNKKNTQFSFRNKKGNNVTRSRAYIVQEMERLVTVFLHKGYFSFVNISISDDIGVVLRSTTEKNRQRILHSISRMHTKKHPFAKVSCYTKTNGTVACIFFVGAGSPGNRDELFSQVSHYDPYYGSGNVGTHMEVVKTTPDVLTFYLSWLRRRLPKATPMVTDLGDGSYVLVYRTRMAYRPDKYYWATTVLDMIEKRECGCCYEDFYTEPYKHPIGKCECMTSNYCGKCIQKQVEVKLKEFLESPSPEFCITCIKLDSNCTLLYIKDGKMHVARRLANISGFGWDKKDRDSLWELVRQVHRIMNRSGSIEVMSRNDALVMLQEIRDANPDDAHNYNVCPCCNTIVNRSVACNAVQCTVCGKRLCIVCGHYDEVSKRCRCGVSAITEYYFEGHHQHAVAQFQNGRAPPGTEEFREELP